LVDEVLAGLFRSGEIHAIYRRWFESPLPGSGLNLRLPMSAALKRVIERPTDAAEVERYR
jgi:glutamate/aspartate transport system substrate-binding protein